MPVFSLEKANYIIDYDKALVRFIADLAEQSLRARKTEESLRQSERLAILGKMASHISHEIKNPLILIGGFARQVLKDIAQDPQKTLAS
jgi:C4-dicarboxylate-specific signal transduction histidine kinase